MSKYENGKIYQITDLNYMKCYIGSTTNLLRYRLGQHKYSYNEYKKGSGRKSTSFDLFDEFGEENCKIELLEQYPCKNKEELTAREGYWIKNTNCINKVIPNRSKQEWVIENKEQLAEKRKIKYNENKEELNKISRKYHEEHKETLNIKAREKYAENKEVLLQKCKERNKIVKICFCGVTYTAGHKSRHEKTLNHLNALGKQKEYKKSLTYLYLCGSVISKSKKSDHEKTLKHKEFMDAFNLKFEI